jgi:hypothetical protein
MPGRPWDPKLSPDVPPYAAQRWFYCARSQRIFRHHSDKTNFYMGRWAKRQTAVSAYARL